MNTASGKLLDQIEATKREMAKTKPRSERRHELELRLRDQVTKLLRKENQISKRTESLLPRKPTRHSLGKPNSLNTGIAN